jgi:ribonuclease J
VLFDFGLNLGRYNEYFKRFYSEPKGLSDLIKAGLVPDPDLFKEIDACFISHGHIDHWKSISTLPTNTKIYANSCTKKIIESNILGTKSKNEHYDHLDFRLLTKGQRVRIKDIEIETFDVNHSIPGANAFLAHTSAGTICYSGDFRLHGRYQPSTYFWEPIEQDDVKVDALVCEGTNSGRLLNVQSELDVEEACTRNIEKCKRLAIIDISANDMERIRTMINVAERTKRKIIVAKRILESIKALQDEKEIGIPNLEEVASLENHMDNVKNYPSKYLVCTSFYGEKEIRELTPPSTSLYILSSSEPFEEEREIDFHRLQNWLNVYGIPMYHIHSSGHVLPLDLRRVIKKIKPKTTFPVHTIHPEAFITLMHDVCTITAPLKNQNYYL